MAKTTMHVIGGFKTEVGANYAAERLHEQGVPHESIGLLMSERARKRLATIETHSKAQEGIAVGGVAGGVLGGLLAGLTSVAALAVSGVGLLAAGPLVSVFAGVGAGATAGGAIGGIIGLGVREHEAKLYDKILEDDGILVTVSTDDKSTRDLAVRVFESCGAIRIATMRGATARIEQRDPGT
jgi:hypothetical protein